MSLRNLRGIGPSLSLKNKKNQPRRGIGETCWKQHEDDGFHKANLA
jgi:hypothetical protein